MTDVDGATIRTRHLRVGVDIGGSKLAVLVVDSAGNVCGRHLGPAAPTDPDAAVARIVDAIEAALAAGGQSITEVQAVGIGVPGRVDVHTGTVTFAVNLGWQALPLRDRLEAALGVPCSVENDVRAAAAGLHRRAPYGPVEDLAYLSIGTGISAGVVLAGRLHRGVRGVAGEIGHVVVQPDGPLCACGLHGCLEAVAAGPAIGRAARDAVAAGRETSLRSIDEPTAVNVFEAAATGDAVANKIVETTGAYIARAVHELALAYDVELIVIGGGVARAGEPFLRPVLDALQRFRDASPFAAELLGGTAVRLLSPDVEAGTWGAVSLVDREPDATFGEEVVARQPIS